MDAYILLYKYMTYTFSYIILGSAEHRLAKNFDNDVICNFVFVSFGNGMNRYTVQVFCIYKP